MTGASLIACARRAIDWGIDFLQIREKDLTDRALYELTCRMVSLASRTGCRILVNGRADIAMAAGAHGVHLPSDGLQVSDIRPWLPEGFCIGVSVHSTQEINRAAAQGADYILLGHLFPTASKQGYGQPLGLEILRKACKKFSIPILGLGGIKPEFVESVLETGAAGVAGITLFQNSADFSRLKNSYVFDKSHRS